MSPQLATLLSAILVIYIGIVVEKHYVSWSSVYTNTLGFIILLGTISMSDTVFLFLVVYTIVGYLTVKMKWRRIFSLFGCKTYGSLVLVLTLGSEGFVFGLYSLESVLISWIVVAAAVHIAGYEYIKYTRRNKRWSAKH